jgi:hypothetical protein
MNDTNYSSKTSVTCPVKLLLAKKDIIRCPKCPYIPFIEVKQKENNIIILSKCQNNHIIERDINIFLNEIKNSKQNIKICDSCSETQNGKTNPINYCINCNLNLCDKCKLSHNNNHTFILTKNLNSTCPKHGKKFLNYCKTCNLNICNNCIEQHESHKIENLKKNLIQDDEIERYKKLIKTSENHLNNVQNVYNKIIKDLKQKIDILQKELKEYIMINNFEIKFTKEILSIYQNEEIAKNINYQIIMNVRNNLRFSFVEIPKAENVFLRAIKFEDYLTSNNNILYNSKSKLKKNVIGSLICNFENKNIEQKNYCIKLRNNIRFPIDIGYEIKSFKEDIFSIQFMLNGKIYLLQNEKNYSNEMMINTLNKLYNLLNPNKR